MNKNLLVFLSGVVAFGAFVFGMFLQTQVVWYIAIIEAVVSMVAVPMVCLGSEVLRTRLLQVRW